MSHNKNCALALPVLGVLLAGCGATPYEFDTTAHISKEKVVEQEPEAPSGVPDLVANTAALPELTYEGKGEVFDVVVDNASVRQVLLSIADQAQLNLDVDPRVDGLLSLNAYNQTIDQILERIRKQLPIRYENVGGTLVVMYDNYYIKQYTMDFPALTRTFSSSADGSVASSGSGSTGSSTVASTKVGTGSVWTDLEDALTTVLAGLEIPAIAAEYGPVGITEEEVEERNELTLLGERSPADVRTSFVHTMPDAGLIVLFGNSEQHRLASEIISQVTQSSRRQVLLQATVVEIALNNQYQQGIDWSIFNSANRHPKLIQSAAQSAGQALSRPGVEALESYREILEILDPEVEGETAQEAADRVGRISDQLSDFYNTSAFFPNTSASGGFFNSSVSIGDVDLAISLLDKFGDTRVVSSPRISTLNGQGAILKVVEDRIYFSIETTRERDDAGVVTETISVTEETLPVGFVVNVYPQIGSDGTIILSMRPSVSRVIGTALAPTVGTGNAVASTGVPIVSVKELETLMLLNDGQTAVMGGLIEDQLQDTDSSVPGASKIPGLGGLFKNTDQKSRRVEYVIFVSARIVTNPSIYGDYREFQDLLPSDETFRRDQSGSFFNKEEQAVPRGQ